jgi:hypothetical protein
MTATRTADGPPAYDPGKNAPPGHDAVSHGLVDGAVVVALFTDLSDFEHGRPDIQPGTDRQLGQLHSLGGYVLGKITTVYLDPPAPHSLDVLGGQKRDLPVPGPGMGVPFDAVIFLQQRLLHRGLLYSFAFGDVDRQDLECVVVHRTFSVRKLPWFFPSI